MCCEQAPLCGCHGLLQLPGQLQRGRGGGEAEDLPQVSCLVLDIGVLEYSVLLVGSVQPYFRGLENRLKQAAQINCKTASLYFLI
jgi:hypothetical protein